MFAFYVPVLPAAANGAGAGGWRLCKVSLLATMSERDCAGCLLHLHAFVQSLQ